MNLTSTDNSADDDRGNLLPAAERRRMLNRNRAANGLQGTNGDSCRERTCHHSGSSGR